MSDRWHILGVGSIGGLFAHRLNAGGADVQLLSRDATERHRQLTLATEPAPTTHLFDCESVEDTAEIEHLLITTKSWGAYDAIQHIQHRLTKRTVVVAMMNGMQHVDDLKSLIPDLASTRRITNFTGSATFTFLGLPFSVTASFRLYSPG